jgi:hypothetical protein
MHGRPSSLKRIAKVMPSWQVLRHTARMEPPACRSGPAAGRRTCGIKATMARNAKGSNTAKPEERDAI